MLHHPVPARLLLSAEVWTVEELLQAEELHPAASGLVDERQMLVEHPLLDVVGGAFERDVSLDLYQPTAHDPAHEERSCQKSQQYF